MEDLIQTRLRQLTLPEKRMGATWIEGEGVYINLWAPFHEMVEIDWICGQKKKLEHRHGYHSGFFPDAKPGDRYYFHTKKKRFPDPASRFQPEGVFGPSEVVSPDFPWSDTRWKGIPFNEWILYEIHTGTFSEKSDFSGIIDDLPRLKALGITTLEIMPVSQFSGERNWGYDGVFPHSVQNTYGGPQGLKTLINACHEHGLAVILDVVYNHIGPEGNVLFSCAPYTNEKYHTPWGDSLNFDGEGSDNVRRYFLQSAWQWLTEYHFDGLRLDAIQMIFDQSPVPFLEELSRLKDEAEKVVGRALVLIAESDMNDPRILSPVEQNGFGLDAQWADDLHHAIHATLTGERQGYYRDYTGGPGQIAQIYRDGVLYHGQYSPFHGRRHGDWYSGIDKNRLVVEAQNHDQIGNRAFGERLSMMLDFEKLKLAAACVFLSPFTPLIFMGEELASRNPFLYFVSHESSDLIQAVHEGRAREWKSFKWSKEPPDSASPETFKKCILRDKNPAPGSQAALMQDYYKTLIKLSKEIRQYVFHEEYDSPKNHILRHNENIIIVLSFNEQETVFTPRDQKWMNTFSSSAYPTDKNRKSVVRIAPFSASIFRRQE